ncbi:hypothetical protein [Natronobeatus ordinarius]|uniref:hypothetical protein n=1 Tax=Natronobeatus ordinarius TaxID=2963433 RepID=UPI0020CC0A7F|nr:hypothetical protein [Natronobeatus ordinarius]
MVDSRPSSLDSDVRRIANGVGFVVLWGWVLLSLGLLPTWFGYPWLGALLSLAGLVICWQAWRASAYPVYTIGTRRDVTVEPIAESGLDCDECGRPAGGGERRRYAERRVLFGTTIAVPEWGTNVYCADCADRLEAEPTAAADPETAAWERERDRDRDGR